MKRILVFTFVIAFIVTLNVSLGAYSCNCETLSENSFGQIIRLQTVAASDNDFDQFVKYEISNAIQFYIEDLFFAYGDLTYEDAILILQDDVNNIKNLCVKTARTNGCAENIIVNLVYPGKENYSPIDSICKAKYPTLQIVIGDGKGQNCQKVIWGQKSEFKGSVRDKEYSLASSVFPSDVKIDIWIVGMIKKLVSSFD